MRYYWAYGQYIVSEIRLPQLRSVRTVSGIDADVIVREQELPKKAAELPTSARCVYEPDGGEFAVYQTGNDFYWLYDDVGTLRIRDGETIAFHMADELTPRQMRPFVLGPGFRSLLVQQGKLVFHASAVAVEDTAVVFVGQSGSGKSTTAAAVHRNGYPILADDLTTVHRSESGYDVTQGVSKPKLTPDIAEELEYETAVSETNGTDLGRQYYDAPADETQPTYPLQRIYVLGWDDEFSIGPVDDRISPLLRGSYLLYDETDTQRFAEHFRRCAALANSVPVRELTRPRLTDAIDEFVSAIESDVTGSR